MSVQLVAGEDRVTIDPAAGGRVASLVAGGRERLITTPPDDVVPHLASLQWGNYVMAPWAGRIAQGRLHWRGRDHQLQPDLGDHAIHGVVHDEPWGVVEQDDGQVVLTCDLDQERWPFGGRVAHAVELAPGHLAMTITVTATAAAMPVWVGWHACFRRPSSGDARIGVEADEVLVTTDDTVPTGERRTVSGDLDLRGAPPLGERRLDDAYVAPDNPLLACWPDLELAMEVDPAPACAVVYTPAHEFCLEAQSGLPDALRLAQGGDADTGLVELDAGGTLTTRNSWTWRPVRGEGQR